MVYLKWYLFVCHNPYFNRWFSAISIDLKVLKSVLSHNPYFNRWFSAIYLLRKSSDFDGKCHNPYFNRWFSAIKLSGHIG